MQYLFMKYIKNNKLKRLKIVQLFLFGLIFSTFTGCEEDDVCLEFVTPRLTVGILNFADNQPLTDSIFVERIDADGNIIDTVFADRTDSIQIPLSMTQNQSRFNFYRSQIAGSPKNVKDIVTVTHSIENVFVSKACGMKSEYRDVSYDATLNQIRNIEANEENPNEITDETLTNLFVFYSN